LASAGPSGHSAPKRPSAQDDKAAQAHQEPSRRLGNRRQTNVVAHRAAVGIEIVFDAEAISAPVEHARHLRSLAELAGNRVRSVVGQDIEGLAPRWRGQKIENEVGAV
jgi:hypothetical protein